MTLTKAALSCGPGGGPGNGASAGSRFRRTVTRPGRGCQSSGRRRGPRPRYLSLGTKPALRPGFGWARLGAGVDQQEPRPEPGPATGGRWPAGPRSCPAQPAARRGGPATRHIPGTAAQLDAVLAVHVGGKHTCPRLRDVPDALAGSAAHRLRSVPAYFGRPPVLHLPVAARMICSPVTAASITPGPAGTATADSGHPREQGNRIRHHGRPRWHRRMSRCRIPASSTTPGSTGSGTPQVIYWGDIDAPGLQFVSDLRGLGIAARTVLMDRATLERYRHLAVTGAGPARHEMPNLKPPEQQLYAHLVQHAADHGTGLQLEQERIPWAHAYQQLTDTIRTPASPG